MNSDYVCVHNQYIDRVSDKKLVRCQIISIDQWERMVSEENRRFFKARCKYGYHHTGYRANRWTSRRWGDNRKFIDTFDEYRKDDPRLESIKECYNKSFDSL